MGAVEFREVALQSGADQEVDLRRVLARSLETLTPSSHGRPSVAARSSCRASAAVDELPGQFPFGHDSGNGYGSGGSR